MDKIDHAKITTTIRRLLALGNNPNENEAAVAIAKATELMARYNLELDQIEEPSKVIEIIAYEASMSNGWRSLLGRAIAEANYCFSYWHHCEKSKEVMERLGPRYKGTKWVQLKFVGREDNVRAAFEMFKYLEQTITLLSAAALNTERQSYYIGKEREWADSWRKGCAARLANRLDESVKKTQTPDPETGTALVPVSLLKNRLGEATNFLERRGVVTTKGGFVASSNSHAWQLGNERGKDIHLGRSLTCQL